MIRIIGGRGSGKTTKLLNLAAENGYVIVAPNAQMKDYVRRMAVEKGLNVTVISAYELPYRMKETVRQKFLVDELEMFLLSLGIEGYSNGAMSLTTGSDMEKGEQEWKTSLIPLPLVEGKCPPVKRLALRDGRLREEWYYPDPKEDWKDPEIYETDNYRQEDKDEFYDYVTVCKACQTKFIAYKAGEKTMNYCPCCGKQL